MGVTREEAEEFIGKYCNVIGRGGMLTGRIIDVEDDNCVKIDTDECGYSDKGYTLHVDFIESIVEIE